MADFDTYATTIDAAQRAESILLGVSALYTLGEQFIGLDSLLLNNFANEMDLVDALYSSTEWTTAYGMMVDFETWRVSYTPRGGPVLLDLSTIVIPDFVLSGDRIGVMQRARNLVPQLQSASQLIVRLADLSALYTAGTDTRFNELVDALYLTEWSALASYIVDLVAVNDGWLNGTGTGGAGSAAVLALTL